MITTDLILSLLLILVTAWALGSLFVRLRLPFILGRAFTFAMAVALSLGFLAELAGQFVRKGIMDERFFTLSCTHDAEMGRYAGLPEGRTGDLLRSLER